MIDNAHLANDLLEKDGLDFVTIGRGFQKNPGLVFAWADELDVLVQMPNQVRFPLRLDMTDLLADHLQFRSAGASVVVEARCPQSLSRTCRSS